MTAPVFAVVGHPNKGKSSLVATLARDPGVRISPFPGTTVSARQYPMRVDGELLYTLVDTPGFQRARRALEWLRENAATAAERPLAVARLVAEHAGGESFRDECELLAPIVAGAGVIYVVDGAVPYAGEYEPEMEILRWTGRPCMAVINAIGEPRYSAEWSRALGQYFSVVREVDALAATFATRVQLLRAFGELDEAWREPLTRAVQALEDERSACLRSAGEALASLLGEALTLQLERRVPQGTELETVQGELQQQYRERLRTLERACRTLVEDVYHHHGVERHENELSLLQEDLFAERSWLVFGLRPRQLALIGAGGGAATGAGMDILTGGASLMLGAALGAMVGGTLGWLTGGQLAEFEVVNRPFGERLLRCGPARSVNLAFVLLGRARLHHAAVAGRTHARRDALELPDDTGLALPLADARRRELGALFERLRRLEADEVVGDRAAEELATVLPGLLGEDVAG